MGVTVAKTSVDTYSFKAENVDLAYLESDEFLKKCSSLRGSVMLIGPMIARFGKALISKPGGDKIGRRRLDTHFLGIQKLGAEFNYIDDRGVFEIKADQLKGANLLLDEASVTGTANIVMAAVLAKGTTTIYNAACEPYLQQLCKMLNRMGAKISGIASNLLIIEGVESLGGTTHTVLPDMIEVGSFIGMAAMTRSELTIKNVSYDNLGIIPESFRRLGIKLEQRGDDIYIPAQESYQIDSFMMNKGFEVIEAKWLFGLKPEQIDVVVHPQSIIHSMVQFEDGAVKAQLGVPDMRVPIQYAFSYPDRLHSSFDRLDFSTCGNLTFEKPDTARFRNLALAYEALHQAGNMAASKSSIAF